MKFLILAATIAVPAVGANVFSKSLRLPDQVGRFFVVLLAVVGSIVICVFGGEPKLGIDLRGGVILVYELKLDQNGKLPSQETVEQLVGTVKKRLDPGNVKEITIRPYGTDKIEVIVPSPQQDAAAAQAGDDQEELNRIKYLISTSGSLEFRITANAHKHQLIIDNARAQMRREDAEKKIVRSLIVQGPGPDGNTVDVGKWVPVASTRKAQESFSRGSYEVRTVDKGSLGQELQVLVVLDPLNVTGQYLSSARSGKDEKGDNAVFFTFNTEGADRFERLTSQNIPANNNGQISFLGILLDDIMQTAPSINSTISQSGQITGDFTEQSAKDLAEILSAGSLPAALNKDPVSEQVVSATLGRDTIASGVNSMGVATIVVIVFMLIYYRFAGLVANLALILNVLLIVSFMIMFGAAFTLSGLAGLALTVGMAVDANVLIYERMREELNRGATLRMAIRNGFDRATVTIVDANVTTLITAIVLYVIGTDQIKGFAVTLTVGILMNLFTAITCTRLMFDIAERNRWVSNLKFMQIMSNTNYDFIGKRQIAYTVSIVFLTVGLIAAAYRGADLFNIDFTGGTSVTLVFEKPPVGGIKAVREAVESKLEDATVQEVKVVGQFEEGTGFKIVTSTDPLVKPEKQQAEVEAKLKALFPNQLKRYKMTPGASETLDYPATPVIVPAAVPALGPSLLPPTNSGSDLSAPVGGLAADTTEASPDEIASVDSQIDGEFDSSCQPASATAAPSASPSASAPALTPSVIPAATTPSTSIPAIPNAATNSPVINTPNVVSGPLPAPAGSEPLLKMNTPFPSLPSLQGSAPLDTTPTRVDPFAGGTTVTLKFEPALNRRRLEELMKPAVQPDPKVAAIPYELASPELEPGSSKAIGTWQLRLAAPKAQADEVVKRLDMQLASSPFFPSSETVGAAVAGGARMSAIWAMIVSLFLVMLYVWFRFQDLSFGFAAILALVHDVLFTIGCLALSRWLAGPLGFALVDPFKIDLTIVAALLTIIGYSLNDTIVIFDRIREVRGKSPQMSGEIINTCVNQTLSRTILTSLTVFLVVVILYFWGGPGIHGFAFAMVVGTMSGTYSTIYVASPFLLWLFRKQNAAAAAKGSAPAIG